MCYEVNVSKIKPNAISKGDQFGTTFCNSKPVISGMSDKSGHKAKTGGKLNNQSNYGVTLSNPEGIVSFPKASGSAKEKLISENDKGYKLPGSTKAGGDSSGDYELSDRYKKSGKGMSKTAKGL